MKTEKENVYHPQIAVKMWLNVPNQVHDGVVVSIPTVSNLRSDPTSETIVAPMIVVSTADPEPTLKQVVAEEVARKLALKGNLRTSRKWRTQKSLLNRRGKRLMIGVLL